MKRRALVCAVLIATLVVSTWVAAQARVMNHAKSGFSLWLPDDWKLEKSAETLNATAKDGTCNLTIFAPADGATMQAALEEVDKELNKIIKNMKTGDARESTVNGCRAVYVDGSGNVDDVPVSLALCIYQKGNKNLVLFSVTATQTLDQHAQALSRIMKSVTHP